MGRQRGGGFGSHPTIFSMLVYNYHCPCYSVHVTNQKEPMSLRHFIIPLMVEGEHTRATLVMAEDDQHGTISLEGKHVCDFEVETVGSVSNYFVAEQVTRHHISNIFGTDTEPVETGYTLPT